MASGTPAVPTSVIKKKKDREALEEKLKKVAELKATKSKVEDELKVLTPELCVELVTLGLNKVEYEGWTHRVLDSHTSSISADRLKLALLDRGMDAGEIATVLKEVTKISPYTTVVSEPKPSVPSHGLTGK